MKKIWIILIFFIIIFLAYFILIPKKIYKKNSYIIEDSIDINTGSSAVNEKHEGFFYLENECGYFSFKQGITHYKRCNTDEYILANNLFYIIYNKTESSIKLFTPTGDKVSEIKINGYPYIYNNLPVFYIINNNNRGFSLYSDKCKKIFGDINFTSLITSISMDKNLDTLVSTIDGRTFLYTSKGEKIFDEKFNGNSKIIISKSNTIDFEGDNIAICSGIYPEYIEVFKKKDGTKFISYKTDTNFRYNILLFFVNNRLYFEGVKQIKFINLKNKKTGSIDIKGEINEVKFNESGNILIASNLNDIYYLTIFSPKTKRIFYKEFTSKISNFNFLNKKTIYFKCDDKILKIKVG